MMVAMKQRIFLEKILSKSRKIFLSVVSRRLKIDFFIQGKAIFERLVLILSNIAIYRKTLSGRIKLCILLRSNCA
jgi:hypothetical protein